MKKFKELIVNSLRSLKDGIKHLFHSIKFTFLYYVAIELVEEMLEEVIAWGVSNLLTWLIRKTFSAILVFAGTQSIKFVIKKLVKKITYKEGNDKVSKIKKFFTWIFANKKSLVGVISSGVATLSGTGVIDIAFLPTIKVGAIDVAPIIYYGVLLTLAIIGVAGKGFEKIKDFFARKEQEKQEKQAKAIVKEAKKEIAQEKKLANQTQSEQEKAKAKADAEAKAKIEKEKADAEHRAKVEEAKKKLLAQNNNNQNA